jgi:hypothetical protein
VNTEPTEHEPPEEERPYRPKPLPIKLRPPQTGPRMIGCPAYPTTGMFAGASIEWCRKSRGAMAACETCEWRET